MKTAFRFLVARAQEASSWRGGIMVLTAAGVALRPETAEAITAFGLALAGLVGLFVPDNAAPAE